MQVTILFIGIIIGALARQSYIRKLEQANVGLFHANCDARTALGELRVEHGALQQDFTLLAGLQPARVFETGRESVTEKTEWPKEIEWRN